MEADEQEYPQFTPNQVSIVPQELIHAIRIYPTPPQVFPKGGGVPGEIPEGPGNLGGRGLLGRGGPLGGSLGRAWEGQNAKDRAGVLKTVFRRIPGPLKTLHFLAESRNPMIPDGLGSRELP